MSANTVKLAENTAWCVKLAGQMTREIRQRLDTPYGDWHRMVCAAERVAAAAHYTSLARLLEYLPRLDASAWLDMMMVHLSAESLQDDMRLATGRTCQEWLARTKLR